MKATEAIQKDLHSHSCKAHATALQRFFKTGPGEYGEGDVFIGVRMPDVRAVARAHRGIYLKEAVSLLHSPIHEERLCALVILCEQFARGSKEEKKQIYREYLKNAAHINNWDLVDISAHKIVGAYLYEAPKEETKKTLQKLAASNNLWERRIAVVATATFIAHDAFAPTLTLSKQLLNDEHDLIHKAVGWMLREVGKRDIEALEDFLKRHYKKMPRTMLRYAIEKFPEKRRKEYLAGRV